MNVTSLRRAAVPAAAAITLSLSVAACSAGSNNTINGAGSTAQQKAQGAWIAAFQSANSKATVNYNPVGSGGGVTKFNAGAVDFAGSDAALSISKGEVTAAEARCGGSVIEVPDYISPIAVVFNVPGVTSLNLDAKTIAAIFKGQITKWNDTAIKALNPAVASKLPSLSIVPVHRSDKSGTTNNFTDYLNKVAPSVWTDPANSVWPMSSGEAGNGTSGVVGLMSTSGAIGYVDDSQAGGLSKVSIEVTPGHFLAPSAAGAAQDVAISKQASGRGATDYALTVSRQSSDATAYPITLVSYLIACPTYPSSSESMIKSYLLSIVSTAGQQAAAAKAGSAPLPANLQSKATELLSAIKAK